MVCWIEDLDEGGIEQQDRAGSKIIKGFTGRGSMRR